MALLRNVSGVLSNDVYTFRCAEDACFENRTGEIFEQYKPSNGSGVFPGITEYPYDPIPNNQVDMPAAPTVVNTVQVATPEPDPSAAGKKLNTGLVILAGLGVLLYMGMGKKQNTTETLLYAGGIGLLYFRMKAMDKPLLPVTE